MPRAVSVTNVLATGASALLLLGIAASAKADCIWSDWAYDAECDGQPGRASIENLAGGEYAVFCDLRWASTCFDGNMSGSRTNNWYASSPFGSCDFDHVKVELNTLKLNVDTGEYQAELIPEDLDESSCDQHPADFLNAPWIYVLTACRIGYDCN
jgi:hypothetical protein